MVFLLVFSFFHQFRKKIQKNHSPDHSENRKKHHGSLGKRSQLLFPAAAVCLDLIQMTERGHITVKLLDKSIIDLFLSTHRFRHILDELSRLATHYGFIDNGKMIKEISADDLENSFRKSIRIEVTDGKALAAVLKQTGQPYKMSAPNVAEIYHRLNISQLTSALDKYHCDLLSIQEQEENLESYYVDLIGGIGHE